MQKSMNPRNNISQETFLYPTTRWLCGISVIVVLLITFSAPNLSHTCTHASRNCPQCPDDQTAKLTRTHTHAGCELLMMEVLRLSSWQQRAEMQREYMQTTPYHHAKPEHW